MPANVGEMFSASGIVPWHKKGVVVSEAQRTQEALKLAGLLYPVEKQPVYVLNAATGLPLRVPHRFATVRMDTLQPLGTVGERYQIIQNEALASFGDALVAESGAHWETAGYLGSGERMWLLMRIPDLLRLNGDELEEYLLLTNTHDGSRMMEALITAIRVVCQNTLSAALSGATNRIAIRHTLNWEDSIEQAREALGFAADYFRKLQEWGTELMRHAITAQQVKAFTELLFPLPVAKPHEASFVIDPAKLQPELVPAVRDGGKAARAKIAEIVESPTGGGTAWHLYNAAVEYADHYSTSRLREGDNADHKRMEKVLWGSAAELKQRAATAIVEVVK